MHIWSPLLVAALGMGATGCYNWVEIKPVELAKLHRFAQTGTAALPDVATQVEQPDGRVVKIEGEFDAEVRTATGPTWFNPPVDGSFVNGALTVRSSNHPPVAFSLQDVKMVRVSQYDATTTWVVASVFTAIGAAIFVVYVARAPESGP